MTDRRRSSDPGPYPSADACCPSGDCECVGVPTWLSALPFIETLQMDWGTRLVPVDELERFVAERRREAREERRPPARPGRKPGLAPARDRRQHPRSARHGQEPQRDRARTQRRRCADIAGRPPVGAFDGTGRSRPSESAQLRRRRLEGDELANGSFARAGLEAHDESNLERLRETLKRGDARAVLA